ncbi:hypothetical protein DES38_10760 [Streptohalobacillus salinus]|uniref:Uncharacterized protein n=1 Tax=Streptohalobacillus salinus TaxID=621096 RepID=A0A2V3WCQ7_9BACI|nr:hypothetical protein [Streptohalobacillus salinus]PXW90928.1 hypothetical protein DES38_10760 [Streptohalobacillus salinus]
MLNQKYVLLIGVILYVLVLQFYFFSSERHLLHMLLGFALAVMTFRRYRQLKQRNKKSKAQFPLILFYFLTFTLFVWYIQPFVVSFMV